MMTVASGVVVCTSNVLGGLHAAQAMATSEGETSERKEENTPASASPPLPPHKPQKKTSHSVAKKQSVQPKQSEESQQNEPISLSSESLIYDENAQTVTAQGAVEIIQGGRIVRADRVTYRLQSETVEAEGHVVLNDTNGDVHFAELVTLDRSFTNGYVRYLQSILKDGSRISAAEGHRINGQKIVMTHAGYTPCEPCKKHPEKPPLWEITADKVTHDEADHSITYQNAKMKVGGVPILYTPYLSHSDGTVKQKSGFLSPRFSLSSQQGFGVESRYYQAISPSEDATVGGRFFTNTNPQLLAGYRKRYDAAELDLDSSLTYSNRKDSVADEIVTKGDELRGHIFGHGLWELNDEWRTGFKAQLTTDDQYLREYDISSDSVLENEIYAERFKGRDYTAIRALAFQDVRVSDRSDDQPNILPEFETYYLGDPNSFFGGRLSWDASGLALTRKGNGQDVNRLSSTLGWQRRDILNNGLVNMMDTSMRLDYYRVYDRDPLLVSAGDDNTDTYRFYPLFHNVTSYPLVKNLSSAQMVVEPTLALTLSTNVNNDSEIPNEDSQDVQLTALNIFDADRFPGLDRLEDRSHATYGVRTGIYENDGDQWEVFLGQSFRFENEDNPFPEGSGLSNQKSDFVGQIMAHYHDRYTLNYGFQLDSSSLSSQRHELNATANLGKFDLESTYLYARGLEGTDLTESREQIYGAATYHYNPEWALRSSAWYDLSTAERGLRNAAIGLIYSGQCVSLLTEARRKYTFADTGDSATEITMSLGFKNLGTFGNAE
ncbi:MAG: LPS-assembly protein LptD [Alphaproteobacteria bacterium]|nr:LPS-assembly protein LptD [Alphaproteobacteria bacterium]